jgi:hypothetical protein
MYKSMFFAVTMLVSISQAQDIGQVTEAARKLADQELVKALACVQHNVGCPNEKAAQERVYEVASSYAAQVLGTRPADEREIALQILNDATAYFLRNTLQGSR